jgi:hypothetical protein
LGAEEVSKALGNAVIKDGIWYQQDEEWQSIKDRALYREGDALQGTKDGILYHQDDG